MNDKNWFQRLKHQVNELYTGKNYRFSRENDHFYQKTMKRFGSWNQKLRDKHKIMNEMADDGKDIQIVGILDGYRGQNPLAMKRIVEHVAALWQAYIEPVFREQLVIAQSKLARIESFLNYLKEKKTALIDYQKIVNTDNHLNSKNYNLILGVLYLVIAAFLIMADYPLSIKVVKEGFQIKSDWESRTLALGIVLMTVYFKIFYDEYIGNSIPKSLLKKRISYVLGTKKNEPEKTETSDDKYAKKYRGIKLVVKLVILTTLILTLWSLGEFRADYMKVSSDTAGTFASGMNEENTTLLFILLSVMFPIIGGICASLGINSLQNVMDRYRITFRLWILQCRIKRFEKQKSEAEGIIQSCEENIKWVSKNGNFIKESAAYFFSYYLHGFEWGLNNKLPENFFDVATEMQVLYTKIQSTKVFYDEMSKSTKDSAQLHSLFFPNQTNQLS